MDIQQMYELLLKEIRARQDFMAKLDADRRTDKEERKADKEEWEANRKTAKEEILREMDEYQSKTDAVLLAKQVMESSHREMVDEATPERNMETMACRETTETHLQEEGMMAYQEMEARLEEIRADLSGHET
jgi:F0F1-type ATP synthase membrane subunit b/b'